MVIVDVHVMHGKSNDSLGCKSLKIDDMSASLVPKASVIQWETGLARRFVLF